MALLETHDLHFSYPNGVRALNGISLTVEAGETVAIVGRNGSGKTTLAKHLNGLLKPQQGEVHLYGEPIGMREPAALVNYIGLVFQNPGDQIFQSRVFDEVAFGLRQLGFSGRGLESKVVAALEVIDLTSEAESHPYDLTLTERKLICLASILAMAPQIVLLDEPTTAQDQFGVRKLIEIVEGLQSGGQTVLTITHDMDFVAEAFTRTIVMREGEIILDGSTASVFAQPDVLQTTYVKPSAISRLAQRFDLPQSILTMEAMADWIDDQHSGGHLAN